jgi:hypothetical protein
MRGESPLTTRGLPKELHDVMERLLDADAGADSDLVPRANVERIDALRAARAVIAAWRKGDIDVAEAVSRIEALVVAR